MLDAATRSADSLSIFFQKRVAPALVFVYLGVIVICYMLAPVLYINSLRVPFIGAFVEHTLMLNTVEPTQDGAWALRSMLDDRYGHQMIAIDGEVLVDYFHMRRVLNRYQPGSLITIEIRGPDGALNDYRIRLGRLPVLDQIVYFLVPYITGLVYLISGLYVFSIRRDEPVGRVFALFTASVAMAVGGLFDIYSTNYMTYVWTASLAIAGGALVNLALLFPETLRQVKERPYLRWLPYLGAILLIAIALPTIYNLEYPTAYVLAWRLEYIYLALAAIFFLVMVAARYSAAPSPIVREQARLIFWGALIAFTPMTVWLLVTSLIPSFGFGPIFLIPLITFPVSIGYAILRYRLLSTDYLISRAVLYALMTALAVSGYALLVSGLSQVFGGVSQASNPVLVGLVVFILALAFNPARLYLQRLIDRAFFRGQVIYRERRQAFGRELTQSMEMQEVYDLLRDYIDEVLLPTILHIFVYDSLSAQFLATPAKDGRPTSDIRFSSNSVLVRTLAQKNEALFLSSLEALPTILHAERARLALLGTQLYVPLPGRQRLIGWLALGTQRSGEPYKNRDLEYIEALGSQAALALERAQVVADLERRVREMKVLTRVAQGVSFTIDSDDILELIYAQTCQVLPTRDFRVTLYDADIGAPYHVFYVENDERLVDRENQLIPAGQGLEADVIRSQHAHVTEDYERECRGRGVLPMTRGIYAWMGVPLNAGAQTIGVLSMGSRDPTVSYTTDQLDVFQAIADQASGAIVKARLLQESENRARQLATLNQISVGLTSNLELKPLLRQILESATAILNCEAGSLFLIDEDTNELVFEVVLGAVAGDLVGKRLPPGTGLVGQAVESEQPVIANDAKRRKQWFEQADQQTGFDTQDLLVVPMRIQERVIGAIEVINKVDGAPFTPADQELLTAFTSQATIAIENARLYTLTDQALAARVEELSVMQRIDHELNTSLEIDRAMRITLSWAMRQSRADAGLVGTVEDGGLLVVSAQGYAHELDGYRSSEEGDGNYRRLPIEGTGVAEAIRTGQPQYLLLSDAQAAGDDFGILRDARVQIVVPIRRETTTIGVLLLESTQDRTIPGELVGFLTRLADHAAIAVANAQLYEEVIEANLAKSRFVSFVAHELKNPMASIKGYTELVAGGVAGPVNEMQTSFLETVRSNVDRMDTIVSDLNDLTKIQVGNLRLEYRTVHIKETLDEVLRSLKRQMDEKEQILNLDLPEDLPAVWVDPARLIQILTNLVSNATKYTPHGKEIFIGARRIRESSEMVAGAEFVHAWVRDTGIGISDEDQVRIFQQYYRTDDAKEMATGTGLGLNITKSLVELQGGRIWFESELGEGSTFHFIIPLAETR